MVVMLVISVMLMRMFGRYIDNNHFWLVAIRTVNFGEGKVLGGDLVVSVTIGELTIKRNIRIKGQNPTVADLHAFIDTLKNSSGLEKLLAHESYNKQFINRDGEPVVSFDQGYGMAQMTNPAPDYTTTWSWKENVKAGRDLFQTKREQAIHHLSQHGTYTDEMVEREAIALWNGGYYYKGMTRQALGYVNTTTCVTVPPEILAGI
ncbi:hypothetical protein [Erwinia persicina]|uniref:hypothetical protein n=1 Tax=Erwinia persicina TaxID=55211 RepID=UPI00177E1AB3|nr:hypothetical protein [Erwinia persicina]MBD8165599.1 hypothetical protein [Erwinia persicina]